MTKLRAIILTLMLAFAVLPTVALAEEQTTDCKRIADCEGRVKCEVKAGQRYFIKNPDCACRGDCKLDDFLALGVEASRFIFGIAGSLALLMFVYGGFRWVMSAGRADEYEKGKKAMVAAVIGLVIIFGAWVLVNTIIAALTGQIGTGGVAELFTGVEWSPQPEAPRR